jgi:methyltransferase-like protein
MIKFNFKFYSILIFACLILNMSIVESQDPSNDLIDPDMAQEILESMKLEKEDRMNRREFKEFFYKILTNNIGSTHPQAEFFKMVTNKFSSNLPKEVMLDKISEVFTQENLYKAIQEVVGEQYGEEYISQLDETYKRIEKEAENIDDDEAMEYYEKSKKKNSGSSSTSKTSESKSSSSSSSSNNLSKENGNKQVEHIEL